MIPEIRDFEDEVEALDGWLDLIPPGGWTEPTQFKGWTVEDVILHLHASDEIARLAIADEGRFRSRREEMMARRADGLTMIEESRERYTGLRGAALRTRWREGAAVLASDLAGLSPETRIPWSGPSMSARTFAVARQMETWAHGHEILDLLGVRRVEHDRIRNIAQLGVKTFGWSFSNRGLPVPSAAPAVRLVAPSGAAWSWNEGGGPDRIDGEALGFCQVVTQVRSIRDTNLSATGETARRWMDIAQCFAGPPSDQPAPGSRFCSDTGHCAGERVGLEDARR